MTRERILAYTLPALVAVAVIFAWDQAVTVFEISKFQLPAPAAVLDAAIENWSSLQDAALVTLRITIASFFLALVLGTALAVVFAQSRLVERALFPYAVILQVTPVVAIAPLILIWVGLDNAEQAVLILATIVAFFPILANTTFGLRSADRQLHELFDLYRASRLQRLMRLQFPAALPYMLAGMKISGGLALIGTVVAEFAAGSGTSTGLAWLILQAGFNLQVAKSFAALGLLSAIGIAIYALLSLLEWQLLKAWHESARPEE
ncbi:MAG: ABC transporter permease [Alphaproteobacteria bacterium]|nr:ABC transporter permease [Alphaproteobacteria bacterium]